MPVSLTRQMIRKNKFDILCLTPLFLFLFLFTLIPILRVVFLSFENPQGPGFTWTHYKSLLLQREFRLAMGHTIIIALASVSLEIVLGLSLALFISTHENLQKWVKPLFILPLAIPTVVVAVMMSFLFSSSGWINRILADIGLIQQPILWMEGGAKSLFMIILADAWKVTPLVMLILLAGLNTIDKQIYAAARIDGAGSWVIFKKITLPLLLPSITTAVIIRAIDAFRIFAMVLILMGQNLKVIGTYAYLEYMDYQNIHASAASSVILFIMILIAVIYYLKSVGQKGLVAY